MRQSMPARKPVQLAEAEAEAEAEKADANYDGGRRDCCAYRLDCDL